MNEEMNAKLEELCQDEEYVNYVLSLGSAEAISKELESKDIDLSPEEIRQIASNAKKLDGELSDENLETVYGGNAMYTDALLEARKRKLEAISSESSC